MALGAARSSMGLYPTAAPAPPQPQRTTSVRCPAGMTGTYPNCKPSAPTAAIGGGSSRLCPDGKTLKVGNQQCPPVAATASGGMSMSLPSLPSGTGGAAAWTPSAVERPALTPVDPQAAYDPEIANQLARTRSYTDDLKAGTGFAMDVLTGQQRDLQNSQLMEAEQAAAQAGIPFDRNRFIMEQQRGIHGAMAQEKLGREQMVGASIGAESGVATAQAGERTDRLGIDLNRDVAENELALKRYGTDIEKYRVDAQAATAANSALMDFYTRLTSGIFSMAGSVGGGNYSSNYSYS